MKTVVFFDSKPVMNRIDPKKRKFLARFGAFVRRRAQSSIRPGGKQNKSSKPGNPPRSHGRRFLKRGIYFGLDLRSESVVVGPVIVPTKSGGADALQSLEYGGVTSFIDTATKKRRRIRMDARPFMGPAFEEVQTEISDIWRSV